MFEYFKNLFKKKQVPKGNYATKESKQARKDEILETDFSAPYTGKCDSKIVTKQALSRQIRPTTPDYIRNSVDTSYPVHQIFDTPLAIATENLVSKIDEENKESVMCKADYQFTVDEYKLHNSGYSSPSYSDSSSSYSSSSDSSSSSCSSSSSSCD